MYKRNHGILCGEQVSLEIRTALRMLCSAQDESWHSIIIYYLVNTVNCYHMQ